ncbi:MAG: hypothetical protein RDV41_15830, partial [Planctomycetota bacterium]|nr:hypothetical protein [Planctomycetota bacterium]
HSLEIMAPRHVQVGEKGYIGIKLPPSTPENGHMKLQIRSGKGVGSLRKTHLHQLPQQNTGGNPPGNGDNYDFVYEFNAARAGTLTFDAKYEYEEQPGGSSGGNGGGASPETLTTITGDPVTLRLTTYAIEPVGDFVEGQTATINLVVQPVEAVILKADWQFYAAETSTTYASGMVGPVAFQPSPDGTAWVAQQTFLLPTGLAGRRDLHLAGTTYFQGGTPEFPVTEMATYLSDPISVLPAGVVIPLTLEIDGPEVIANVIENQNVAISVHGTTPDFVGLSIVGALSDGQGQPLGTCSFMKTDLGGGSYSGSCSVGIPSGTGGQTLFLAVLATCVSDPTLVARDSVTIEVLPPLPAPVIATVSAPYGDTITEGQPAKFKCTISPVEVVGRIQDFSYRLEMPSVGFSQILRLDPNAFVAVGDAAECEFDVIVPVGSCGPGVPSAAGLLNTRLIIDFRVYVSNYLDVTVFSGGPVPPEPPRFTFITPAPVVLREACSTIVEFTISDGDPNALLQTLDAITFAILDPATGEEVAHFNIDP